MNARTFVRRPKEPIIVDLFCGFGGTSEGVRRATGRSPTLAVNHWPSAIADHARAHPETRHITADVFDVDYERLLRACPRLVMLSPSCTHHSNAAGGAVRDNGLRSHPMIAVDLARSRVAPDVFIMENVREILSWGPLLANGRPDNARRGEDWRAFVVALELAGYKVAWKILNAADFGAPTARRRLFMVARRDQQPIVWPEPTHGPGRAHPWVPAASVIDWSVPCPSIFGRKTPLAATTMRRIAEGVRRFVLNGRPFIVNLSHGGRLEPIDAPMRTTTTAARGERMLVAAHLDRAFTGSTGVSVEAPLPTVCASFEHHALITSFLVPVGVGERPGQRARAVSVEVPLNTVTASGRPHELVQLTLDRASSSSRGRAGLVAAFLSVYHGDGGGQARSCADPMPTLPANDSVAVHEVRLELDGEQYIIADIGARMLTVEELKRANGLSGEVTGTKKDQVKKIGNAVVPAVAEALIRANLPDLATDDSGSYARDLAAAC